MSKKCDDVFISLVNKIFMIDIFFQSVIQSGLLRKKSVVSSPIRNQTYDLLIITLDALPLSCTGELWELGH